MHILANGMLLIAAAGLAACAHTSRTPADGATTAPATANGQAATTAPQWRSAEELVRMQATPTTPDDQMAAQPPLEPIPESAYTPADDLDLNAALRREVASRCAERPGGVADEAFLRELVTDLYAQGTHPADATEALLLGGCAAPEPVVRELVAQGGEAAAPMVIERAVSLGARPRGVERAAADGLARYRLAAQAEPGDVATPLAGANTAYSMVYFPLAGSGEQAQQSSSLVQLFDAAAPGYGVYTFILYGDLPGTADNAVPATYRELLRVIETYVVASDNATAAPDARAHSFLVPVHGERGGMALAEQTGPELSAQMRGEFASYLRAAGQPELAQRLSTARGPFLVSSLEPRLLPADRQASRLLVDLTDIGPEYMVAVVDAYDRPIAPDAVGKPDALLAIRDRLLSLFPDQSTDAHAAAPPVGRWVYPLGDLRTANAAGVPTAHVSRSRANPGAASFVGRIAAIQGGGGDGAATIR